MLLQEPRRAPSARDVSGSDTESLHGVSEGDGEVEHTEETPAPPPVSLNLRRLDIAEVDLEKIFERRAAVLRTVSKFHQGSFRSALRVAVEEEAAGRVSGDEVRRTRAWKLFLLPRMLLHKPPRGGLVHRKKLGTFCSLRSGKVGRIVPRQSRNRRASQCPNGAKTQERIHGRFVKASSESSFFRPDGRVVSSQASIGGSSVGSWNIGHSGRPRQKTFCTSRIYG